MNNINWKLFNFQKNFILILVFVTFSFKLIFTLKKPHFQKEDLLVNVNIASKDQLIKIPYIGEKTAHKILKLREETKIKTIDQLKQIRFFNRFKYFLKTD